MGPARIPLLAARHGAGIIAAGRDSLRAICGASRGRMPGLRMALSTDGPASDALQREWRSRFGTGLDPAP